jgi:HPt (histidine-containing phosphotransfer) domain-containing protein
MLSATSCGRNFAAMSNSDPTLFERLAKVEPAKLARLLVELAAQDQTILEQVQLLLASGDTAAIAKAVRSTLRAWKRSLPFIHYQEAFAFGEQLDRLLDSVEDGLLGPDPALALDLLEEFLQSDRWILERVDDSAGCIGTAYRRRLSIVRRRRGEGGFARRPGRTDRPPCGKGRPRGAPQPAGARPPIFGQ